MAPTYFKLRNGYEINGLWYPRVTSICNIIAKPGLERWLADQESFAVMQVRRKKVTDWGSLVHEIVEKILLGKKPNINPVIQPSIDAFLDWLNNNKIKVLGVEKKVLSKDHSYAGTLDILAEIDGRLGVLDLKTSKEIWNDYFIQTSAYVQAYNEKSAEKAETHWVLRIDQYQECVLCDAKKRDKSGEPVIKGRNKNCIHKWSPVKGAWQFKEVKDHQVNINTFLAAKKLWELSNRSSLSRIENYPKRFKV